MHLLCSQLCLNFAQTKFEYKITVEFHYVAL